MEVNIDEFSLARFYNKSQIETISEGIAICQFILHFNGVACFRCEKCKRQMESSDVKDEKERLIDELKSLEANDTSALDDFLRQHATVLPECNQLAREIQYRQVTLFKNVDQELLDPNELLKKSYLCEYTHM